MSTPSTQLHINKIRLGKMIFALIAKQYKGHESKKQLLSRIEFVRNQIRISESLISKSAS